MGNRFFYTVIFAFLIIPIIHSCNPGPEEPDKDPGPGEVEGMPIKPEPEEITWWIPEPGISWDVQFDRFPPLTYHDGVEVYILDLYGTPDDIFNDLKSRGNKIICYVSTGTLEVNRADADEFPEYLLGNEMAEWEGEFWLDVRYTKELRELMGKRFDYAKERGCDAIDADNMDSYSNSTGLDVTMEDQVLYNAIIATEAHDRGMAIGLKNALVLIETLVDYYDFGYNEQCYQYNECHYMRPFIEKGKAVFGIEYKLNKRDFCDRANEENFDFLVKGPGFDLGPFRESCR
ncbi:MAG: endo alpha-1,4 polygalactosaminidase [Bacteriovoracaceae bacterium]|jgi:hypothetical protein|nr:endo alpha-1,4 polygalactosaminidase [Bacteriovoracaceae bacterium]